MHEAMVNPITRRALVLFDPGSIGAERIVREFERRQVEVGRSLARWHLAVSGLKCGSCVRRIENAVMRVPGVHAATVNLATESLTVEYTPRRADLTAVRGTVRAEGFDIDSGCGFDDPAEDSTSDAAYDGEFRSLMQKFWLALLVAIPTVLLSYPAVFGYEALMLPGSLTQRAVWGVLGLLALPVMFYSGLHFYQGSWAAVKHLSADMNTLIAIGITTAWLFSSAVVLVPSLLSSAELTRVFYDVTVIVVVLVVLGQAFEVRARRQSSSAIRKLMGLQAKTARVVRDGRALEVPFEEVVVGDIVVVRPGEIIAVDGTILDGRSAADESHVTGASLLMEKHPGSSVIGSTINKIGSFRFRATRVGKGTMLSQIIRMVGDAQETKAPIQRLVDVASSYFVPAVISLAILGFMIWYTFGPEPVLVHALVVFVTMLVIASPAALGLAASTSLIVGIGKGAENGILFRSGRALEDAQELDTIVLNKTGTITRGEPSVTDVVAVDGDEAALLALAASVEREHEHPLAGAIVREAQRLGLRLGEPTASETLQGRGVRALLDGREVVLGNHRLMDEVGLELGELTEAAAASLAEQGRTPIFIGVNRSVVGVVALADTLNEDSVAAIAVLRKSGIEVVMLTSDNERTARAIGRTVGVDRVLADVPPEAKAQEINLIEARGKRVAVVGEGIEDAQALAQADVGISLAVGTDVAAEAADITLVKGSLGDVITAIQLSRATMRNVKQNLFGTFVYHLVGLPLAAGILYPVFGILLSPLIAVGAMAFSSVTVMANGNRLRGFVPQEV